MISVIVPIYNVEEYLDDCINSLLNQTYRDLEIVLVDDGSTDRSGIICDFYGEKDNRIKVLHKENGGLMSAWKYGVLKSRGDYIGFVDSDDWIDKDMYQRLFERISESNADIVLCGLIKEFSNNKTEYEVQMLKRDFYSSEQVVREILPIAICSGVKPNRGISPNRVTKLYKRDLLLTILNYCSDEVSIGEDLLSTIAALAQKPSISIIHNYYPYHYRINNASMVKSFNQAKYENVRSLNTHIKIIDKELGGVFSSQIANDYIDLILKTIEQEILVGSIRDEEIVKDILNETNHEVFLKSLSEMDKSKLSKKNKLYLFLINNRLFKFLFYLRRSIKR